MDLKQEIYEYLQTQHLMALSTNGNIPWSAIVYYAVDENLNLFFLSESDTEHCKNIEINNKVSVAIYDSSQPNDGEKSGVQLWGTAKMVVDKGELLKTVANMWNSHNPGLSDIINVKAIVSKTITGRFYKTTPKRIKLFNTEFEDECKILDIE